MIISSGSSIKCQIHCDLYARIVTIFYNCTMSAAYSWRLSRRDYCHARWSCSAFALGIVLHTSAYSRASDSEWSEIVDKSLLTYDAKVRCQIKKSMSLHRSRRGIFLFFSYVFICIGQPCVSLFMLTCRIVWSNTGVMIGIVYFDWDRVGNNCNSSNTPQ